MSHFYGVIDNHINGAATRRGHRSQGLRAVAASQSGAIEVVLSHDERSGKDSFSVKLIPWKDYHGPALLLTEGEFPQNENPA